MTEGLLSICPATECRTTSSDAPTMSKYESTIIPLDDAHEFLAAFRIDGNNREYQRWRRDDGFRWGDFEDVLHTSPLILGVDWREWLHDSIDTVIEQLAACDITATAELGDDGERGSVSVNDGSEQIKYVPNDEDDFDAVIASINRLIAGRAEYRKLNSCEGSDGWSYVLPVDQWTDLSESVPQTVNLVFASAVT